MAKRLGGSLLGFGVKSAGEFCMSYECAARRGARERAISYINTCFTNFFTKFKKYTQVLVVSSPVVFCENHQNRKHHLSD
jgi:hypothetical protein